MRGHALAASFATRNACFCGLDKESAIRTERGEPCAPAFGRELEAEHGLRADEGRCGVGAGTAQTGLAGHVLDHTQRQAGFDWLIVDMEHVSGVGIIRVERVLVRRVRVVCDGV